MYGQGTGVLTVEKNTENTMNHESIAHRKTKEQEQNNRNDLIDNDRFFVPSSTTTMKGISGWRKPSRRRCVELMPHRRLTPLRLVVVVISLSLSSNVLLLSALVIWLWRHEQLAVGVAPPTASSARSGSCGVTSPRCRCRRTGVE